MGDRTVARAPLPTQDNTNTGRLQIYIHALSGIRTQDHNVRAVEDSTGHRPRRYSDLYKLILTVILCFSVILCVKYLV
jgi:hypothetical protein